MFNREYVEALANQDPLVENDLIAAFTKPLKMKVRTYFSSPQAADDACQETMLRVFAYFRSGKTLRNPACLPGFIHSVCDKVIWEMIRAQKRERQASQSLLVLIDNRPDPENETIASECRQRVLRLLAELSNKDQELLWCVYLNEENRNTLCEKYHITRDYLRLLLYRARARFKALAAEIGFPPDTLTGSSIKRACAVPVLSKPP
jgi:RNA polymerase sigma-70 factor, ECF subfamily